jgi:1,4-alpha-glucan branching enzyme
MQRLVRDLNRVYRATPALHVNDCRPEGFDWIESNDADAGVFAFVRKGSASDKPVVAVINMTPVERKYRLGLPAAGTWQEILNTDAEAYGGGNRGNLGGVTTEKTPWHGQMQSALVTLPPLSAVYLQQD